MKKRILFVDDEPAVLDGLRNSMYRERKRWDVVFAAGAECALAALREQQFDVVVSDMRMPGMDGAALLSAIKAEFPATARIMLSGHADAQALAQARTVIDELLMKPCSSSVLRDVLERTLAKGAS